MNIGKRLSEERRKAGFTRQEQLGGKIDVSFTTISRWEKEESPIPSDKLLLMADLGLDINYILQGETANVSNFQKDISYNNNNIKKETADVSSFDLENYAFVPLYNVEVSAGHGSFADAENIITHLAFTKYSLKKAGYQPANLACVMATGDSMLPTITPRETLMIDTTKRHADGGIFVLRAENQLYIKRLMHEKDGIRVISDNPVYPEWILSESDDFEIIGKKVWQARWD